VTRGRYAVVVGALLTATACGGGSVATSQDLGSAPDPSHSLGGTAQSDVLRAFSTYVTVSQARQTAVSITVVYVGAGRDELLSVSTPYGGGQVGRTLTHDQAQALTVPLQSSGAGAPRVGSQVTVTLRLASHGSLQVSAPVVRVHAPVT